MPNNTRETEYLCKNSYFQIKFVVIITPFFYLGDIVNKVTLQFATQKYLPLNLHNTHKFINKMQGTRE